MKKNYIAVAGAVAIFLLVGAGVFLWQENQKAVADLNKNLPEGIRVEKSFIGNNYKVVNKIDGYEFRVPSEWMGLEEIEYTAKRTEGNFTGTSLHLQGKEGMGRLMAIDQFHTENILENFAAKMFEDFELVGELSQDEIEKIGVVKTKENVHLAGAYIYFFKGKSVIYTITNGSENYIREIISSGKWQ